MNQETLAAAAAAGLALGAADAVRATDHLIPGKIHIIKDAKLTKMVAKPLGHRSRCPTRWARAIRRSRADR